MSEQNLHSHQYLIYARKSTDDTDNQKNSIAYQKIEAVKFAKARNLPIADFDQEGFANAGAITERHTGFKEDNNFIIKADGTIKYKIERPKFHKLVSLLHQGRFKGVIFLCWDRASRNRTDDNILRKLMDQHVDILFVQANYDKSSSGELHKDIDGMFAQHYSRVIKEKVTNTTRQLRNEGICTYKAPIGYLNLGDPRHKPFDLDRAPIIKQLFIKYAESKTSLHELARWANNQNLTMPPVRRKRTEKELLSEEEIWLTPVCRPLTYNNVHKILINKFYAGFIKGNDGKWVKSTSHKQLISEELFNIVQQKRHSKRTSVSYDIRLSLPYRGIFRCDVCGRVFTPYKQKTGLYYGARCTTGCSNKIRSFNQRFLEERVGELIASFLFDDDQKEVIKAMSDNHDSIDNQLKQQAEVKARQKNKTLEDLGFLQLNKIMLLRTLTYTPEEYLDEVKRLEADIRKFDEAVETIDLREFCKNLLMFSELTKSLHLLYVLSNSAQKEKIISNLFSELKLCNYSINYKAIDGFSIFESPYFAFGDPKGWFSEAVKYHKLVEISIKDIRKFLSLPPPDDT